MPAEKRYQVFISSTFRDLIDERQAVLKAVLELDHMPAGMELFPASDESAWELIKGVIDASDYYVLIIGGRYGSLDDTGIGYTEKEYDYAVLLKKPVIPLLNENPDNLPRGKTETDATAWKKLLAFRKKVEDTHTCVYWDSVEALKASVIVGLTSTVKKYPSIGWIRADQIPSDATLTDILTLRNRIEELEAEIEGTKSGPPSGTENLFQGTDSFKIETKFEARSGQDIKYFRSDMHPTWDGIFAGVAPTMISEVTDRKLRKILEQTLTEIAKTDLKDDDQLEGRTLSDFTFENHDLDTIVVQLRALGLIKESDKKRSVKDLGTYWALTSYGDKLMVRLRALSKTKPVNRREAETAEETPKEKGKTAPKKKGKKAPRKKGKKNP